MLGSCPEDPSAMGSLPPEPCAFAKRRRRINMLVGAALGALLSLTLLGAYASAPLREHLKFEDDLLVDLEYFPIALEDTLENVLGASLDHQGCPYAAASTSAILLGERSGRPGNLKEALALHEN